MKILRPLDAVEIIAPASRSTDEALEALRQLLISWQLTPVIDKEIFGQDLLCAQTDAKRFELLKKALYRPETKAIFCVRGGYGAMRLIPQLLSLTPPKTMKWFLGMSDITALHLFLQQHWQWPVIHGNASVAHVSSETLTILKSLLFGENTQFTWKAEPLNRAAKKEGMIDAPLTGGNLTIVQTSIGTPWQLQGAKMILALEDVSERGYRVDRMLEHLRQAALFQNVSAIVFGDFIKGEEPDGSCLIPPILKRFAESVEVPVLQIQGFGHGRENFPMIMGLPATLKLGMDANLAIRLA